MGRIADGQWKVAVTAAPEGGAANRALERLLGSVLDVPVRLVRGAGSRSKLFEAEGIEAEELRRRLERAAGA